MSPPSSCWILAVSVPPSPHHQTTARHIDTSVHTYQVHSYTAQWIQTAVRQSRPAWSWVQFFVRQRNLMPLLCATSGFSRMAEGSKLATGGRRQKKYSCSRRAFRGEKKIILVTLRRSDWSTWCLYLTQAQIIYI